MQNHKWAKLAGWLQFALSLGTQVTQGLSQSGAPHGVAGWITLGSSLATAVAVHAAASTDGNK